MHQIHVGFENDPIKIEALRAFGFDEGFLRDFLAMAGPENLPARIVEVQRGRFSAIRSDSSGALVEVEALASGSFMNEASGETRHGRADETADGRAGETAPGNAAGGAAYPAVGDWVLLRDGGSGPAGPALIEALLPRRNAFIRKRPGDTARDKVEAQVLAANVDSAFIVMAAGQDWNPRRLERYLALARQGEVRPVVVITKADLADDAEALLAEAVSVAGGAPCALVCAPEGRGLEPLAKRLEAGKTIVLLGSSGAGKSTLLNALAGRSLAATGEVRQHDERGRHTTTHRQLYRLPNGALIIDSPGLREVQLWAEEDTVDAVFGEIEQLAERCRFRDCGHGLEPGCAVRAALDAGELENERYESWRKLRREVAYLDSRQDPLARRAEVDRWKSIHKSMRGYTKERRSLAGRSRD